MALYEINFDDIRKGYRDVEDPGHERYTLPQGMDWGERVPQQDSTSAGTSRNTIAKSFTDKNIPWNPGQVNLDIGGGKYDTATDHMRKRGVTNLVFDPYNRDSEHNNKVLDYIERIGGADTVTVNNVLNVIRGKDIIMSVIRQAAEAVKPGGIVFFKIYNAGKGTPAYTRDGFQQSKPVELYIPLISQYFSRLKVSTGKGIDIIAAAGPKNVENTHADFYPDMNGGPRQLKLVKESKNIKVKLSEQTLRRHIRQQIREAANADLDREYLEAVQAGDVEKAGALFKQAAKAAGFIKKVYHNTDADFTMFDTDEDSATRKGHVWMADYIDGTIFLSTQPNRWYGKRTMPLLINPENFKRFDIDNGLAIDAMDNQGYAYEVTKYNGIRLVDKLGHEIFATLNPKLVKSAEPVTYDDQGNVIPLSQRFSNSDDIRYEE